MTGYNPSLTLNPNTRWPSRAESAYRISPMRTPEMTTTSPTHSYASAALTNRMLNTQRVKRQQCCDIRTCLGSFPDKLKKHYNTAQEVGPLKSRPTTAKNSLKSLGLWKVKLGELLTLCGTRGGGQSGGVLLRSCQRMKS